MKSEMDSMKFELNKRVSNTDLKLNFKALNDMLFIKFTQLEDIK